MAFTVLVLAALVKFSPMAQVADADKFHDLSKLMFAFVLLWAYFSVSQLLIIWSANLPEEIPFYLERLHGVWAPVSISLLLLQFALPFMLLLSRNLKRNPQAVRRDGLGPGAAHLAVQTSTFAALLDGAYDGEVTIGELLADGDLGLGTLDGTAEDPLDLLPPDLVHRGLGCRWPRPGGRASPRRRIPTTPR